MSNEAILWVTFQFSLCCFLLCWIYLLATLCCDGMTCRALVQAVCSSVSCVVYILWWRAEPDGKAPERRSTGDHFISSFPPVCSVTCLSELCQLTALIDSVRPTASLPGWRPQSRRTRTLEKLWGNLRSRNPGDSLWLKNEHQGIKKVDSLKECNLKSTTGWSLMSHLF